MKVENRGNEKFVVLLEDVFDFKRVEDFRVAYQTIPLDKCKEVSIDFSHTRYIDSSALGMLLNVKAYFKASGAVVKIISVNEQIRKILTISRFDQRFIIE
ncbi:MAG TPA: STAS domain-containing protein [Marinagarivorans sp.]